jgi:hypothetical protein
LEIDGQQQPVEVVGWHDLGVQVRLPELQLGDLESAELVIVRGDGAATNPITIQVAERGAGQSY